MRSHYTFELTLSLKPTQTVFVTGSFALTATEARCIMSTWCRELYYFLKHFSVKVKEVRCLLQALCVMGVRVEEAATDSLGGERERRACPQEGVGD